MRVFVAGATGYVGSAIVDELLAAGHRVLGLARSDASARALHAVGAEAHRGDLDDLTSLADAARATDGTIYAANKHITETTDNAARAKAELAAVEAIGSALAGSDKPFVVTSGLIGRDPGHLLVEDAPIVSNALTAQRLPVELSVLGLSGVRSSSVRLSPTVHGEGDSRGFISLLMRVAHTSGVSAFVGDGDNRWPAVHRRDAATLFRLALESAPTGTAWHAAAEEGVPFREIAEAIGRCAGVPAQSVSPEAAAEHFGLLGGLVSLDSPASSAITRERLGWQPSHPGLIADIDAGVYSPVG